MRKTAPCRNAESEAAVAGRNGGGRVRKRVHRLGRNRKGFVDRLAEKSRKRCVNPRSAPHEASGGRTSDGVKKGVRVWEKASREGGRKRSFHERNRLVGSGPRYGACPCAPDFAEMMPIFSRPFNRQEEANEFSEQRGGFQPVPRLRSSKTGVPWVVGIRLCWRWQVTRHTQRGPL